MPCAHLLTSIGVLLLLLVAMYLLYSIILDDLRNHDGKDDESMDR